MIERKLLGCDQPDLPYSRRFTHRGMSSRESLRERIYVSGDRE